MGSGSWSATTYHNTVGATRKKAGYSYGSGFTHTANIRSGRVATKVHETLDPKDVKLRESRDSDEHPTSTAITVLFDVTGSMANVPNVFVDKLPGLFTLLMLKGYVEHPQIMIGAIGDATCDRVPLQISQWESDNRIDEALTNVYLERGGGGQKTESYELAMYFMARHTEADCFVKRGKKPYLFLIGDEMAYPQVNRRQVEIIIGDVLQESLPTDQIVEELKRKFEVFFIIPAAAHHGRDIDVLEFWRKYFGQNTIVIEDESLICETIALQIGLAEGAVDDLDDALDDATEVFGSLSNEDRSKLSKALATVGSTSGKTGGIATVDEGGLPDTTDGADRL